MKCLHSASLFSKLTLAVSALLLTLTLTISATATAAAQGSGSSRNNSTSKYSSYSVILKEKTKHENSLREEAKEELIAVMKVGNKFYTYEPLFGSSPSSRPSSSRGRLYPVPEHILHKLNLPKAAFAQDKATNETLEASETQMPPPKVYPGNRVASASARKQPPRPAISSKSAAAPGYTAATTSLLSGPGGINQLSDEISGVAGVDYPLLASIPRTKFNCADQAYSGYYVDIETRCQVFHVCLRVGLYDAVEKWSFLCPNGTLFSQQDFSCVIWNYAPSCDQKTISRLYKVNEELGWDNDPNRAPAIKTAMANNVLPSVGGYATSSSSKEHQTARTKSISKTIRTSSHSEGYEEKSVPAAVQEEEEEQDVDAEGFIVNRQPLYLGEPKRVGPTNFPPAGVANPFGETIPNNPTTNSVVVERSDYGYLYKRPQIPFTYPTTTTTTPLPDIEEELEDSGFVSPQQELGGLRPEVDFELEVTTTTQAPLTDTYLPPRTPATVATTTTATRPPSHSNTQEEESKEDDSFGLDYDFEALIRNSELQNQQQQQTKTPSSSSRTSTTTGGTAGSLKTAFQVQAAQDEKQFIAEDVDTVEQILGSSGVSDQLQEGELFAGFSGTRSALNVRPITFTNLPTPTAAAAAAGAQKVDLLDTRFGTKSQLFNANVRDLYSAKQAKETSHSQGQGVVQQQQQMQGEASNTSYDRYALFIPQPVTSTGQKRAYSHVQRVSATQAPPKKAVASPSPKGYQKPKPAINLKSYVRVPSPHLNTEHRRREDHVTKVIKSSGSNVAVAAAYEPTAATRRTAEYKPLQVVKSVAAAAVYEAPPTTRRTTEYTTSRATTTTTFPTTIRTTTTESVPEPVEEEEEQQEVEVARERVHDHSSNLPLQILPITITAIPNSIEQYVEEEHHVQEEEEQQPHQLVEDVPIIDTQSQFHHLPQTLNDYTRIIYAPIQSQLPFVPVFESIQPALQIQAFSQPPPLEPPPPPPLQLYGNVQPVDAVQQQQQVQFLQEPNNYFYQGLEVPSPPSPPLHHTEPLFQRGEEEGAPHEKDHYLASGAVPAITIHESSTVHHPQQHAHVERKPYHGRSSANSVGGGGGSHYNKAAALAQAGNGDYHHGGGGRELPSPPKIEKFTPAEAMVTVNGQRTPVHNLSTQREQEKGQRYRRRR